MRQEIVNACVATVESMRADFVPHDTGNLANQALKYDVRGNEFVIYVDMDPSKAPYMPYTNEPWLSEKWHGKKNPNEGWWGRFAEEFASRLARALHGEIQ